MDALPSLLTGVTALLLAIGETIAPLRPRSAADRLRHAWPHAVLMVMNLGVVASMASALRGAEAALAGIGWAGPLAALPAPAAAVVAVLALDLRKYALHRAKHRLPALWQLHRSHHDDEDLDLTSRFRFHPAEAALDELTGFVVAVALGIGAPGFLLYRSLQYPIALISHANLQIPEALERAASAVFVSPGLHRVHHAIDEVTSNTNYGELLSIWDRLFGTLNPDPAWRTTPTGVAGHPGATTPWGVLADPFVSDVDDAQRPSGAVGAL